MTPIRKIFIAVFVMFPMLSFAQVSGVSDFSPFKLQGTTISPKNSSWSVNLGSLTVSSCTGCGAGSSASTTLLTDHNTFSGVNLFTNASSDFGGTWQGFSPSAFDTFGYPFPNQLGGGNATSSLTGFSGGVLVTASSTVNANFRVNGSSFFTGGTYGFGTTTQSDDTVAIQTNGTKLILDTYDDNGNSVFHVGNSGVVSMSQGIDSGYWHGTKIGILYGGTNLTSVGASNTVMVSDGSVMKFNILATSQLTNDSGFLTSAVTAVTATSPILSSGGNTPNITWTGLATTSQPSSSNLLTSNGLSGVYGTATSTLSASSPLTGSFTQLGSGGSLGCQTASGAQAGCLSSADWTTFNNKGSGTVTSITLGSGLDGTSPITTSGTIIAQVSTSTNETAGHLPYYTSTSGTPAKIGDVATSSVSAGSGIKFSATAGALVGGSNLTVTQNEHRGFTYATSTAWTGTTTVPLETAYGETFVSVRCFTDAGTLNADFYHSTNHLDFFNASTTNGTITFATNNTMTSGDKTYVDIGTPASSPTKINCTWLDNY